jgi:hypothetical protein
MERHLENAIMNGHHFHQRPTGNKSSHLNKMGKHRSVAVWLALLFGVLSNGDSNELVNQAVAVDCKITRTGASHCQFLATHFVLGDTVQLTVTQSGRVITCRRGGDAAGEENTWYGFISTIAGPLVLPIFAHTNRGPVPLLSVLAGMGTVMGMQEMPTLSFSRTKRVIQNYLGRSKWEAIAVRLLPTPRESTRFFVHQLFYSIRRTRTEKSHPCTKAVRTTK